MNRSINKIIAITMTTLVMGCAEEEQTKVVEPTLPVIKIETVNSAPVEQQAEFTATIEPLLRNNISPSMGLRIDEIHVEVGDIVKKGDVLVVMDKRQYLQSAVQLANLETDFARMERLLEQGGISQQQLDQLETQLEVSRHATENLRENSELVSPISGIVTERLYDPGDIYSPTTAKILTVMQINQVKVMVSVPERYFPLVDNGTPVDISLEVYPQETFEGKVTLIHPALDAASRTFMVEITINNPKSRLRPGMLSRATMRLGEENHVLVPDISVLKQSGSSERYLFVYNPKDSTVSRRTVETGRIIGKNYEILSGVEDGEQVVIAGMQKLLDADKVKVVK